MVSASGSALTERRQLFCTVAIPAFLHVGVKDKEGIKEPKSSLKMFISPNNCQFGSKFCIRPDEADAFLVNTHLKCSPGTRMQP
jgi:hypothetical protein